LDGLWKFIETVKGVREVNPHLQILGILPTMADNTNTTQDGLNTLKEN
jgi:cellulose biosynthesis protein BcsQ